MKSNAHVTKALGLNITSHEEINFVDIVLNPDTKLFIDPCLIDTGSDSWSLDASRTIKSFFKSFYDLYRDGNNSERLKLFYHAHEINATKLGYGNGTNGHAKTPEGLITVFSDLPRLLNNNLNMNHPIDLVVFIKDFAEDCLSDMLTNVLFKELNNFTLEQCDLLKIDTRKFETEHHYWNTDISGWDTYKGRCLKVHDEIILLVPKRIVRNKYYYNTSQYFGRIILENIQEEKQVVNSEGKIIKPTKKELRKNIRATNISKMDFSIDQSFQKPILLDSYHSKMSDFYRDKGMTDEQLDFRLYGIKK